MNTSFAANAVLTPKAIRPSAMSIAPTAIDRVPCIGRLLSKQTVETADRKRTAVRLRRSLDRWGQFTAASSTPEGGTPDLRLTRRVLVRGRAGCPGRCRRGGLR